MSSFVPTATKEREIGVVDDVLSKDIEKSDGTQFRIYDVVTTDGKKFSSTKKQHAESAYDLKGQAAEFTFTTKVNGNFTNYWIDSILPAPSNPAEIAQRAQEAQPVLRAAAGLPEPERGSQGLTAKDKDIHRQVACKVAAALGAESSEVFWANVVALTHYMDTGETPGLELLASGSSQDDDIPFD